MLHNSLDPALARNPEHLVVHGGAGRAIRSWEAFDLTSEALRTLEPDETLLVQSGMPVARFRTDLMAPRVLLAHSIVVPAWASAEEFRTLEARGLTTEGRIAAGAWLYTGLRSFLATAFEAVSELADQHFDGSLASRLVVTSGLGASGAAQAPAIKMAKGTALIAEADAARIDALQTLGVFDHRMDDLDQAIEMAVGLKSTGTAEAIVWHGNGVDMLARLSERGVVPDVVTDMTGGLDSGGTYVSQGLDAAEAQTLAGSSPRQYESQATESVAKHLQLMIELRDAGAMAFEFGNALRAQAELAGVAEAFEIPGFYSAFVRRRVLEGRSPIGVVALTGERGDVDAIEEKLAEVAHDDTRLLRYLELLRATPMGEQGLPSQTFWLRYQDHVALGLQVNRMVRDQDVQGPVLIFRGPLDPGTVTSPFRETEQMPDGSDAVADWPVLAGMLAAASGATWVSLGHGGGAGIGFSLHSSVAMLANGSPEADQRIERVLTQDPAFGLMRYAAAKDPEAAATAKAARLPLFGAS